METTISPVWQFWIPVLAIVVAPIVAVLLEKMIELWLDNKHRRKGS